MVLCFNGLVVWFGRWSGVVVTGKTPSFTLTAFDYGTYTYLVPVLGKLTSIPRCKADVGVSKQLF